MNHGLTQRQLGMLKHCFRDYADKIDQVALFGSRAKGTHQENSDIDLVIYGTLDSRDISRLWTLIHESSIPYKVDVNDYRTICPPSLKQHIDRHAVVLFTKEQLAP